MKNNSLYFVLLFTIGLTFSCKKDKADDPEVIPPATCPTISFATDVLPIFQSSCAFSGCHSTASASDGIRLSNYAEANAVDTNRLLGAIKHTAGFDNMPQGAPKLEASKIQKIECWIRQGRQNN